VHAGLAVLFPLLAECYVLPACLPTTAIFVVVNVIVILQDPKELAKWRRKQSNREAARRSRARKAEQAEGLQQQLAESVRAYDALQVEKSMLQQQLVALHAQAQRLNREREALKEQVYGGLGCMFGDAAPGCTVD
jgi:regulator of replication initiation timing